MNTELPPDAPSWAQIIYDEVCQLRRLQEAPSLTVGTSEVAKMLGMSDRQVRTWAKDGKMPKAVNKTGERYRWNRVDIERMAIAKKAGGRPRKNG